MLGVYHNPYAGWWWGGQWSMMSVDHVRWLMGDDGLVDDSWSPLNDGLENIKGGDE